LEGFNWKFNPKAFDRRQPAWSPSVEKEAPNWERLSTAIASVMKLTEV
jgi:hypothetical protein